MIDLKTKDEISIMRQGGTILAQVLNKLVKTVKPGISELELDKVAKGEILKKGGQVSFKKVKGYRHTICVSSNDVVVHGIPTSSLLKEGDVFGIDCGVYYGGYHTDMAETLRVKSQISNLKSQSQKDNIDMFLETGKRALKEAIKVAKAGNRIGHISKSIQDTIEAAGYSVVRSLVGHGVGKNLHEEPEVPGFLAVPMEETLELKEGMTLAIEVIYNMGKPEVVYANNDGWTIKTKDGSLSGVFERTIAVTKNGPLVLTQ